MFELHQHKIQALYYKPSYERLRERIAHAAPDLDVVLIDEAGQMTHGGETITQEKVHPDYFWIHSEMFKTPVMKQYFELLKNYRDVKWLHTINTGLDMGPYLELLRKGVTITNNHSQAIAIAEYVMARVLALYQNLPAFEENQSQAVWKYRSFREISRTRWLIIGFGHIGRQIAQRARGFGVDITAVRRGKKDEGLADQVCQLDNMNEYLAQADIVVLACASNDDTRDLVDRNFLANMKDESTLVNIARGDIVVENDLRKALDDGKPGHAILDVFRDEPLPADAWFWSHPSVTLTPHCSNGGSGMLARSDELFIENLYRIRNGQLLLNQVSDKDIL